MAELNWSDAQWQKVNDCVTEAFGKASVASAVLPCYGPLPGSAEIVRNERLIRDTVVIPDAVTVRLDADHDEVNLKLVNVTVNVLLSSEQVIDETLSNAMLAFRRAANMIAQEEDRIVFDGLARSYWGKDSPYVANTVKPQIGLADLPARQKFTVLTAADGTSVKRDGGSIGPALVSAVVRAIEEVEENLYPAPFACVLGNTLFEHAHDPTDSLVLPADRITPLLKGGPLVRSGKMNASAGVVVSLAGNAIDIVVGTPPVVQFLQRTSNAKFLFRVYERFVLRIRDKATPPYAGFKIEPTEAQNVTDAEALEVLAEEAAIVPNLKVKVARAATKVAQVRKRIG